MPRSYSELVQLETYEERYAYLRIRAAVGGETFGYERWINQAFYTSSEWKRARRDVIARDYGCDLGMPGFEIHDKVIVHHMNPMTIEALVEHELDVLDPEYLICVSHRTHNAIHYGDETQIRQPYIERRPNDTSPWRK